MAKIHPSAVVDPKAELADDVEIGPYCLVEPGVSIGAGTVLRSHVVVRQYTTIGAGNKIDPFCSFGGEPQDYKFDPAEVTYLRIGDENVFREGVTISRATGEGNVTVVGNKTMWMAGSHAGHNATICDRVIMVNQSAAGGHATIEEGAILSGGTLVHQYVRVGTGVMTQGLSGISTHVPPYCMTANVNCMIGLNAVGLRRNPNVSDTDRAEIKEAFALLYRRALKQDAAVEAMDAHTEWGTAAAKFRDFIHWVRAAEGPHKRPLMARRRSLSR